MHGVCGGGGKRTLRARDACQRRDISSGHIVQPRRMDDGGSACAGEARWLALEMEGEMLLFPGRPQTGTRNIQRR